MHVSSPTSAIFDFSDFFTQLNITQRVEDIIRVVNSGQSQLETLVESYKVLVQKHKGEIQKHLSNVDEFRSTLEIASIEELQDLHSRISEEIDIILACELFEKFLVIIRNLKVDTKVESDFLAATLKLRRRNEEVVTLLQRRTEELCLRLMYAAEEQRARKSSFARNLEDLTTSLKNEMIQLIVLKFQQLRVEKLRELAEEMEQRHCVEFDNRLAVCKTTLIKMRFSNGRIANLEHERNTVLAEKRRLPVTNQETMSDLDKLLTKLNAKVHLLEARFRHLTLERESSKGVALKEKEKMSRDLSRLLCELARRQATLCKLHRRAVLNNITLPPDIIGSVCSTDTHAHQHKLTLTKLITTEL